MAFTLSSLPDYVNQLNQDIKLKTAITPVTAKALTAAGSLRAGIKSQDAINKQSTSIVFQTTGCGITPGSNATASQRILKVAPITVSNKICAYDLEAKWQGAFLSKGSEYTELAFAEKLVEDERNEIAGALEKAIWQGDTASGNAALNKFDGFLKIMDTDGGAAQTLTLTELGISGAVTKANILDTLEAFVLNIPAKFSEASDFVVFIGSDLYKVYRAGLRAANIFQPVDDMTIYGTASKMIVTDGLAGTKKIFGARLDNMVYGTDGENEHESMEIVKDPITKFHYINTVFKAGVQVAWVEEAFVGDLN